MAGQANLLFNAKTVDRLCQDVKISSKQRQAAKEWLQLLQDNKLEDEKSNYPKFMQMILQDILGYPIKEINYERGNVEFQFANSEGKNVLCFEAKGTSTSDLFAPQHRTKKEHETPIKQTWDYMGSIGLDYGICTNYKDFVLITKQHGYSKYHIFDFNSIKRNEEKLKEFIGIFSKERLIDRGFIEKLHKESVIEEREFTKEFYKLFHETRLMMKKSFEENPEVTSEQAIRYTQLYLNRLIFMFFAEDHDFLEDKLFTKRVTEVLNSPLISEHSKMVSDEILGLFQAMDKGSHRLGIFGFNGGLFQDQIPSKIYFTDLKDAKFFKDVRLNSKLKIKPNEETQKIINKYQNELNPIIVNLLMMDSFDFTTEVNVNILGHIFEQSISDLEELRGENTSRRKKEGVYYTPEYITDHICRNTIVPYLSKSGTNSIPELIDEYKDDIEGLEKKFKEIKILDPACGSGAFLVKAVDILLEIHKEIQIVKESKGKYATGSQFQLTKWNEEAEARIFVENNIYGVDINEESVEITKLSLFLKIASKHRKLSTLNNIKIGNSLIDDKSIDIKAFHWKKEFPNIFFDEKIKQHEKEFLTNLSDGFDVVIGNPPYVQLSMNKDLDLKLKEYLITKFNSSMGRLNTFGFFTRLGIDLLKNNGKFGMIIPNTILTQDYYEGLREIILNTCKIKSIVNFSDLPFKDAIVENVILILQKTSLENERTENKVLIFGVDNRMDFIQKNKISQSVFANSRKKTFGISLNDALLSFHTKMNSSQMYFNNYFEINQGIALKHDRAKYIVKERLDNTCRRVLDGKDINRYVLKWGGDYLRYDINAIHSCKREDIFITSEKLLFRRVGNRLIATFDDKKFYALNTLVIMNKKEPVETNILYFLALFNSKLLNYYYKTFLKSTKKVFSEIQAKQVGNLPVIISNEIIQTKIIDHVKKIMQLNKQLLETEKRHVDTIGMLEEEIIRTDNEIDELIYKIYNLTDKEKKMIV